MIPSDCIEKIIRSNWKIFICVVLFLFNFSQLGSWSIALIEKILLGLLNKLFLIFFNWYAVEEEKGLTNKWYLHDLLNRLPMILLMYMNRIEMPTSNTFFNSNRWISENLFLFKILMFFGIFYYHEFFSLKYGRYHYAL
jgi:hypothetical protein